MLLSATTSTVRYTLYSNESLCIIQVLNASRRASTNTTQSLPLRFSNLKILFIKSLIFEDQILLLRIREILNESLLAEAYLYAIVNFNEDSSILNFNYSSVDTADCNDLVTLLE